jgi:hypothetical protein
MTSLAVCLMCLLTAAGTLNLDTLQVQEPPPGYWEKVVDCCELDQQQMQTLATGFNSYQQKAKPVIAAMHAIVGSIHGILDAAERTHSHVASSTAGAQQQPDQQGVQEVNSGLGCSGELQQPGCAGDAGSAEPELTQQQAVEDGEPLQQLWEEWHQQPHQQDQAKHGTQQRQLQAEQGMQQPHQPKQGMQASRLQQHQQQHQKLLQELLQQGESIAGWDNEACSHVGDASIPKPWQQFGLSHGCLTIETAEVLEGHMTELMQHVMKLREVHRTVTWLFLNVLTHKQHVLSITAAWPWWTQPLPSKYGVGVVVCAISQFDPGG